MKKHRPSLGFLCAVVTVAITTAIATIHNYSQSNPILPKPASNQRLKVKKENFEATFPSVNYETSGSTELQARANDEQERAKRKIKNKRYDKWTLVSKTAPPLINETVYDNHWRKEVAGIPAAKSDHVVVGEVLSGEAHLSNDKTSVYSEFTILLSKIVKNTNPTLLIGTTITVDRPGGFVTYPGGERVLYRLNGLNMPEVGKQYLLFLSNTEENLSYTVLTGYELTEEGVYPLDTASQFDRYKGTDETAFLKLVKEAMGHPNQVKQN